MAMLSFLNIAQLVLYIALLSLMGQGVLHVLAGARREGNTFYRLLQVLTRPFLRLVRAITPRGLSDAQVAWLTFGLLATAYAVVTFERMDLCVTQGLVGRAGCR